MFSFVLALSLLAFDYFELLIDPLLQATYKRLQDFGSEKIERVILPAVFWILRIPY